MKYEEKYPKAEIEKEYGCLLFKTKRKFPCANVECKTLTTWRDLRYDMSVPCCSEECAVELYNNATEELPLSEVKR